MMSYLPSMKELITGAIVTIVTIKIINNVALLKKFTG